MTSCMRPCAQPAGCPADWPPGGCGCAACCQPAPSRLSLVCTVTVFACVHMFVHDLAFLSLHEDASDWRNHTRYEQNKMHNMTHAVDHKTYLDRLARTGLLRQQLLLKHVAHGLYHVAVVALPWWVVLHEQLTARARRALSRRAAHLCALLGRRRASCWLLHSCNA